MADRRMKIRSGRNNDNATIAAQVSPMMPPSRRADDARER
jgi:hypothetical protein